MSEKKSTKKENYTTAQTEELIGAYTAASTEDERRAVITEFAEKLKKPQRSIIAKLSREKVYIKPEKTSEKTGNPVIRKEDLEETLKNAAGAIGFNPADFSGISKAPKAASFAILEMIRQIDEYQQAEEIENEQEFPEIAESEADLMNIDNSEAA